MGFNYDSYEKLGESVGALVSSKQAAYGDSFSKAPKIISVLYPDGISPDQIESALTVIRVIDKLNRIATNKVDLMGENPWGDIAGYSILEVMKSGRRGLVSKGLISGVRFDNEGNAHLFEETPEEFAKNNVDKTVQILKEDGSVQTL
jgi:hypothetical protein